MRQWQAEGIILNARAHGETSAIVDVLTAEQGRVTGLLRGGQSRRITPMLQPGNRVHLEYHARLDTHLGQFRMEPLRLRAGFVLHDRARLAGLSAVTALCLFATAEEDPHPALMSRTESLLDALTEGAPWYGAYLRWEISLLEEMGFGLDLSACAVTGARDGLAFVSPRSGRAVSRQGAGNWVARLLPLPRAVLEEVDASRSDMAEGLALGEHFLQAWLAPALGERAIPEARRRLGTLFPIRGPYDWD